MIAEGVITANGSHLLINLIRFPFFVAMHHNTILFFLSRDFARVSSLGGGGYSDCRGRGCHPPRHYGAGCPLQKEKL